jgi:hypothetical protein
VTGCERSFVAGLDLGQRRDHSAIAVVERCRSVYDVRDPVTWDFLSETRTVLTHVERLPLGTAYGEVVERVWDLLGLCAGRWPSTLVVDETGVGAPVVEALKRSREGASIVPVTITGGDRSSVVNGSHRVPKRDLVTGLQLAFENRELEIAGGMPEMKVFLTELMSMRVKVTAAGHERYESWREGSHDDLVLAVALAWWRSGWRRPPPVWGTRRLL